MILTLVTLRNDLKIAFIVLVLPFPDGNEPAAEEEAIPPTQIEKVAKPKGD